MNRLVSLNLDGVRPDLLPPAQREAGHPARLLFLSHTLLGFRRYHERLMEYAGQDPDIDAVHIELRAPLWQKVVAKGVPGLTWSGWDLAPYRHYLIWRARLTQWLLTSLPMERFDAVHVLTHGNAPNIGALKMEARRRGTRAPGFALSLDSTAKLEARELGFNPRPLGPFMRAEQQMFDACDLIVCRNGWCSRDLESDYGVPPGKVHVARNSLHLPPLSRLDLPPRRSNDLVRLAFVGNHWGRKGGPELLQLHQARFADRVELHVCSERAPVDATARNVVWHGAVENQRLREQVLPRMDIMILPTRIDMHPWAILEAQSIGLPVISSRIAGIPEMVRDGETGLLCPPDDWNCFAAAIERLAGDALLRERMGEAARAHVQSAYDADVSFGGLMERLKHLARAGANGETDQP